MVARVASWNLCCWVRFYTIARLFTREVYVPNAHRVFISCCVYAHSQSQSIKTETETRAHAAPATKRARPPTALAHHTHAHKHSRRRSVCVWARSTEYVIKFRVNFRRFSAGFQRATRYARKKSWLACDRARDACETVIYTPQLYVHIRSYILCAMCTRST